MQQGSFAMVPEAVFTDRRLGHAAVHLYVLIARRCGGGGECWQSQDEMAAAIGGCRSSINESLSRLEKYRYIVRVGNRSEQRYRLASVGSADTSGEQGSAQPTLRFGSTDTKVRLNRHLTPDTSKEKKQEGEPLIKHDPSVVKRLFTHFRERVQPAARICPDEKIRARLKKFTEEELCRGIDNFAESEWWMEHNGNRGAPWFFYSDSRCEQFLNLQPEKRNGREHSQTRPSVYDRIGIMGDGSPRGGGSRSPP